jgi:DNA-directed RNA polymerase specialized sigma24 family protein
MKEIGNSVLADGEGAVTLGVEDFPIELWMEKHQSELLGFTSRKLMKALEVHYDPEDVLQDAFLRAWDKRAEAGEMPSSRSFVLWMRKIIHNRVLDLRRRLTVREKVWPASVTGAANGEGDVLEMLTENVSAGDYRAGPIPGEVDDAVVELKLLPFEEQLCVLMRDVLKVEWKAVAVTVSRTVEASKSLRFRARGREEWLRDGVPEESA